LEGGSGIVVGKLEGHQLEIRAANLAKDGKLLISGSIDGTLRVWDTEHGREIAVFEAGYVLACALSPDGRMAVSSNASGGIKIWDIINNCLFFEFTGHSGFVKVVAWSASGDSLVSGGADGNLHIWDARQRQLKATLQGHKGPVLAAGFVLDDRELISMGFDDTFIVWDAETGKKKKRLQQQAVRMPAFESGSDELDYIKIWDLSGNQLLAEIKGREVAVHNFGRHFEGRKIIYDFYHKDAYLEVSGKIFDFEVQGLAPSPDGRLIAAGRPDGSVSIWNIGTGRIIQVLRGHVGKVRFCGWPAGKRLLISSGDDGKIILWDLEAGERQSVYFAEDSVRAVAFAADGMRFVAGDNSGNVYFIKVEEPDLGPILKRKKS
jgi:WD40 repeat protein